MNGRKIFPSFQICWRKKKKKNFPERTELYKPLRKRNKLVNKFSNHHHVVRSARISLTLSLHVSLSFITSGRSSGLHPVSSHSCCMYVWAGHPAFDWPYAGGPQEYITYELVLASPAVSCMSGSSSLDSFRDRW